MSKFEQWWQKEEDLMRQQGADDETILGAMRNIAGMAWDAAQQQWQPFETAPKDGTQFLLRVGATVLISRYSDEFLVVTGDLPKGEHKWYWAEIPGMAEDGE